MKDSSAPVSLQSGARPGSLLSEGAYSRSRAGDVSEYLVERRAERLTRPGCNVSAEGGRRDARLR